MESLTTDEIIKRSQISSDFSHIRKINSGGFGTVYDAISKKDGSNVAIKVLDPKNDNMAEKFNEIMVSRQMKHPHIIYVSDIMMWESRKEFFIVMEKGQKSLDDLLSEKKILKKGLIFQILCDAISGLQYAAKHKGISHGDLKPHNILINCEKLRENDTQKVFVSDKNTTFKLVDWGCSTIQGEKINKTVTVMGQNSFTIAYSPPEIIQHHDYINLMKSDVYSLGFTILSCCGVDSKKFKFINKLKDKKEHDIQVQTIFYNKKYRFDEKYSEVVEILKKMISYDSTERPDYDEILDYVAKVQKKLCFFCQKSHVNKQTLPDCNHKFERFCLIEHFELEFSKNSLYIPSCPLSCCNKTIDPRNLKEILGEKLFHKKYIRCNQCQKLFSNVNSVTLGLCNHNFCFKCFNDIAPTRQCPLCKKDFSKREKKNFESQMKKCSNCSSESEDLPKFDCCSASLCNTCLSKGFSSLLDNQMPLFCWFCREPFKKPRLEIKKEEQNKIMVKKNSGLKASEEKKEEESKIIEKKNRRLERPPDTMCEQLESDQYDEEKNDDEFRTLHMSTNQATGDEEVRTLHMSTNQAKEWRLKGFKYEKQNNHGEALECFIKAAELGDMIGMFKAANYFFNGKYDVEQDMETAFYFYKHSSDKGYPPAMFSLAYMFKNEGKIEEAILYYEKASNLMHPQANCILGEIYEKRQQYNLAIKYYKEAVRLGDRTAAAKLRKLHQKDSDFEMEPNFDKSLKYYKTNEDLGFYD